MNLPEIVCDSSYSLTRLDLSPGDALWKIVKNKILKLDFLRISWISNFEIIIVSNHEVLDIDRFINVQGELWNCQLLILSTSVSWLCCVRIVVSRSSYICFNFYIFRLRMNSTWSSKCWVPPLKITGLGLIGEQDIWYCCTNAKHGAPIDNVNLNSVIQHINSVICTGLRSCKATSSPTMLQSPW